MKTLFNNETSNEFQSKVLEICMRDGFESVYNKLIQKSTKSGTKMEVAERIFDENVGKRRCEVIKMFMENEMSEKCASTYYQTIFKKRKQVS